MGLILNISRVIA